LLLLLTIVKTIHVYSYAHLTPTTPAQSPTAFAHVIGLILRTSLGATAEYALEDGAQDGDDKKKSSVTVIFPWRGMGWMAKRFCLLGVLERMTGRS